MSLPARSVDQRMEALHRANAIRTFRAEIKRELKHRQRDPVPLLSAPPPELETMRVLDFLLAVPKYGRVKAARTLGRVGIAPSKTVAGLSERQRGELVGLLRG